MVKRISILLLILFSCRPSKLGPDVYCGQACSPDPNITVENLERGACKPGWFDCEASACIGAVLPTTETCGNQDLDCDGVVGNAAPRACRDQCGFQSWQDCDGDSHWEVCQTHPEEFNQPEVCNGRDDNCNGLIDENIPAQPCYPGNPQDLEHPNTACRYGTQFCEDGGYGDCEGAVTPTPEICDGIDNNCNGIIDEGCDLVATLTWDLYNEDLDLHLGIPLDNGGSYTSWFTDWTHDCYYANCTSGSNPTWDDGGFNDPHLNHDDIYDTGPEITQIVQPVNTHPYYVAVHWYDLPGSTDLPTGTLTITCGGTVVFTGTHLFTNIKEVWYAGEIDADSGEDGGLSCKYLPINLIGSSPGTP